MVSGRIGCEFAVLAVVCVLSIFLFPCVRGPYCVVHGPATALRAIAFAARLRLAIFAAAFQSFSHSLAFSPRTFFVIQPFGNGFHPSILAELVPVLRC
jgi:hypothetical protein